MLKPEWEFHLCDSIHPKIIIVSCSCLAVICRTHSNTCARVRFSRRQRSNHMFCCPSALMQTDLSTARHCQLDLIIPLIFIHTLNEFNTTFGDIPYNKIVWLEPNMKSSRIYYIRSIQRIGLVSHWSIHRNLDSRCLRRHNKLHGETKYVKHVHISVLAFNFCFGENVDFIGFF